MLRRLAGRTHTVWTGVAVATTGADALRVRSVESRVTLRAAREAELRAYVATGEPLDKAGAYALQGEGRRFVSRVDGSETNVIGLPLEETLALLAAAGLELPRDRLTLAARLAAVRERIARAAARAGRRAEDITLVGVSKRQPAEAVAALVAAGLAHCGENFVQEAREKIPRVAALLGAGARAPRWHFVGRLQTQQGEARGRALRRGGGGGPPELARALDAHAAAAGPHARRAAPGERERRGAEGRRRARGARARSRARSRRLRAAAPRGPDDGARRQREHPEDVAPRLRAAARAARRLVPACGEASPCPELSMGMSADFEVAIEEGATIVRVGTALFGARGGTA